MGEPAALPDQLSVGEINLLLLLDSAGVTFTRPNGSIDGR